jgi:hypothetical protein
MWWCIPVIPAVGQLRQEDSGFEAVWAVYPSKTKSKTKQQKNGFSFLLEISSTFFF